MVYHRIDLTKERAIPMIGKIIITSLLFIGSVHAGLEIELQQQLEIEKRLQTDLEIQKKSSEQAYRVTIDFVSEAVINREEQIDRLKAADTVWNDFIEKTCSAESIESIGTRAENANNLQCMIKRFKEKEAFFKSLI